MQNKISWQAPEHKNKERSTDWYWAVGIIVLSVAIIAVILNDGFFAILIILGIAILISFTIRPAKILTISLDQRGLIVDREMYPYATLESFWVDIKDEENPKIIFKSKKTIMPLIIVPLEDYHHLDARDFLLQFLEEKEMEEPVSHKVMEKLGF
jgi:hypothetical protein